MLKNVYKILFETILSVFVSYNLVLQNVFTFEYANSLNKNKPHLKYDFIHSFKCYNNTHIKLW